MEEIEAEEYIHDDDRWSDIVSDTEDGDQVDLQDIEEEMNEENTESKERVELLSPTNFVFTGNLHESFAKDPKTRRILFSDSDEVKAFSMAIQREYLKIFKLQDISLNKIHVSDYLHLRHEMLSSMIRVILFKKCVLETDVKLSEKYHIDSKKTPDAIWSLFSGTLIDGLVDLSEKAFIIDFAFVMQSQNIDYYKKNSKGVPVYTNESRMLSEKYNIDFDIIFLPLSFSDGCEEILTKLDKFMTFQQKEQMKSCLNDLLSIFSINLDFINTLYCFLDLSKVVYQDNNEELCEEMLSLMKEGKEYHKVDHKISFSRVKGDLVKEILDNRENLVNSPILKEPSRNRSKKFILVRTRSGYLKVFHNNDGVNKEDFINILKSGDLDQILSIFYHQTVGVDGSKPKLELYHTKTGGVILSQKVKGYRDVPIEDEYTQLNRYKGYLVDSIVPLNGEKRDMNTDFEREFYSNQYFFDDDYFEKLLAKPMRQPSHNEFCGKKVSYEDVTSSIKTLEFKVKSSTNTDRPFSRNPFIYPICDVNLLQISVDFSPNILFCQSLHPLINSVKMPETKILLDMIAKGKLKKKNFQKFSFSEDTKKLRLSLKDLQDDYITTVSDMVKKYRLKSEDDNVRCKFPRIKHLLKCCDSDDAKTLSEQNKKIVETQKLFYKSKNKDVTSSGFERYNYLTVPKYSKKSRNPLSIAHSVEMQHYRGGRVDNSTLGCFSEDFRNEVSTNFENFAMWLCQESRFKINQVLERFISQPDNSGMSDLKMLLQNKSDEILRKITPLNAVNISEFISRMCYTVLYHSKTSCDSKNIFCDNLGFSNVLLMVRGGKPILKTGVSRLFKIIIPINDIIKNVYFIKDIPNNFQVVEMSDVLYLITPWMQIRKTTLTDGISSIYSCVNHLSSCFQRLDDKISFDRQNLVQFISNIILHFHGKRKTEIWCSNLRYMLTNTMGDYSKLTKLISTHDLPIISSVELFLIDRFLSNYMSYLSKCRAQDDISERNLEKMELPHLFFPKIKITNPFELANIMYVTNMMSKAPVSQNLEQAHNLGEILSDIDSYCTMFNNVSNKQTWKPFERSFLHDTLDYDNDFTYDPIMSNYLGYYMSFYLQENMGNASIQKLWNSILNRPIDSVANSSGLRGSTKDGQDFFNKKGYEVTYDFLLSKFREKPEELVEIFKEETDRLSKMVARIQENNITFKKCYAQLKLCQCIYHVVDKIQMKGPREVYTMDLYTKLFQQGIELFFKGICKFLPNELISIPSNKRKSVIHHTFFEDISGDEFETEIYNWIMDCRRWAPRCMIQKYVYFIWGMRRVLPIDFVKLFLMVMNLMLTKKVYTKEYVFKTMINNKRVNENVQKYLHKDDKIDDAYYFYLPFSFVMGMYNYLSSFVHASAQILISDLVYKKAMADKKFALVISMAHSDDSAAKSFCSKGLTPVVFTYYTDINKSLNHMLSEKKSCLIQGWLYFEVLSIMYLFGELLTPIGKFLGKLLFKPTDKGYASDISQCISKVIEILSEGGTFLDSYITYKLYSQSISRFYNMQHDENSFNKLTSLGGIPDCHPFMYMIMGSDADIYRILTNDKKCLTSQLDLIHMLQSTILEEETMPTLSWDLNRRMNKRTKQVLEKVEKGCQCMMDYFKIDLDESHETDIKWVIKNLKTKHSIFNIMWYYLKLKDPMFYSNMQNEQEEGRIIRLYSAKNEICIKTILGKISWVELCQLTSLFFASDYDLEKCLGTEQLQKIKEAKGSVFSENFLKIFFEVYKKEIDCYKNFSKLSITSIKDTHVTLKPCFISNTHTEVTTVSSISPIECCLCKYCPEIIPMLMKNLSFLDEFKVVDSIITSDFGSVNIEWYYKLSKSILGSPRSYHLFSRVTGNNRNMLFFKDYVEFICTNSFSDKVYVMTYDMSLDRSPISNFSLTIEERVRDFILMDKCLRYLESLSLENDINYRHGDRIYSYPEILELLRSVSSNVYFNKYLLSMLTVRFESVKIYKLSFTSFWLKEQKFFKGGYWGFGQIVINLKTSSLLINVNGLNVDKIYIINHSSQSSKDTVNFDVQESNFISLILTNYTGTTNRMVLSDNSGSHSFGLTEDNMWYFGNNRSLTRLFYNTEVSDIQSYPSLQETAQISFSKDVFYHTNRLGKKIKIISSFDSVSFNLDFLDKFCMALDSHEWRTSVRPALIQQTPSVLKVKDQESLLSNFISSFLYRSIYDKCNLEISDLIDCWLYYKDICIQENKRFGFPSKEEFESWVQNYREAIISLPASVTHYIPDLLSKSMDHKLRSDLRYDIYKLFTDRISVQENIAVFTKKWGVPITDQSIISYSKKTTAYTRIPYLPIGDAKDIIFEGGIEMLKILQRLVLSLNEPMYMMGYYLDPDRIKLYFSELIRYILTYSEHFGTYSEFPLTFGVLLKNIFSIINNNNVYKDTFLCEIESSSYLSCILFEDQDLSQHEEWLFRSLRHFCFKDKKSRFSALSSFKLTGKLTDVFYKKLDEIQIDYQALRYQGTKKVKEKKTVICSFDEYTTFLLNVNTDEGFKRKIIGCSKNINDLIVYELMEEEDVKDEIQDENENYKDYFFFSKREDKSILRFNVVFLDSLPKYQCRDFVFKDSPNIIVISGSPYTSFGRSSVIGLATEKTKIKMPMKTLNFITIRTNDFELSKAIARSLNINILEIDVALDYKRFLDGEGVNVLHLRKPLEDGTKEEIEIIANFDSYYLADSLIEDLKIWRDDAIRGLDSLDQVVEVDFKKCEQAIREDLKRESDDLKEKVLSKIKMNRDKKLMEEAEEETDPEKKQEILKKLSKPIKPDEKVEFNESLLGLLPSLVTSIQTLQSNNMIKFMNEEKKNREKKKTYGFMNDTPQVFLSDLENVKTRFWDLLKEERIKAELDVLSPDLYSHLMTNQLYITDENLQILSVLELFDSSFMTKKDKENWDALVVLTKVLQKSSVFREVEKNYKKSAINCDRIWTTIVSKLVKHHKKIKEEMDNLQKGDTKNKANNSKKSQGIPKPIDSLEIVYNAYKKL